MNLTELTQVALLGTERQPLPKAEARSALTRWQAQISPTPGEHALLASAALALIHERVGRLPARHVPALPAPSNPEKLPSAGSQAGDLLRQIQSGQHPELLSEWLAQAARAGQLAPPEALPDLLTKGAEKFEWQGWVRPVLGERGRWLAAQNSAWAWVADTEVSGDEIWHTGDLEARRLFLRRLRLRDPARARDLLAAAWKQESTDNRIALLGVLPNSVPEDEPFLESVLDDKRKEVRLAAAALLAQLPGSALVQRMISRTAPLLKFTPAKAGGLFGLRKSEAASLEVTLPMACGKDMQRDGIEIKPPPGTGEKSWWLRQMLEVVPLTYWTESWPASPADILAGSLGGEWKKELWQAWTGAACRQRNAGWAQLLIPAALQGQQSEIARRLLAVLPVAEAEHIIAGLLTAGGEENLELQSFLVFHSHEVWSADFSRHVLVWLRRLTASPGNNWQLRNQLMMVADHLSPQVLAEAAEGWPLTSPGWESWGKAIEDLLAAVRFRHDLIQSFPPVNASAPA